MSKILLKMADIFAMKNLALFLAVLLFLPNLAQSKGNPSEKVIRILSAMSFGNLNSESELNSYLKSSCQNNKCHSHELQSIQEIGRQMVYCQVDNLNKTGVKNTELNYLCRKNQAMLGCDSLATPLMRKMCYTSNRYSLQKLAEKEVHFHNRMPASAKP